jgi:hypothetical protein
MIDPDELEEDEAPTLSTKKEHRAARLIKNWWSCTPSDRIWIESLAESLAQKKKT